MTSRRTDGRKNTKKSHLVNERLVSLDGGLIFFLLLGEPLLQLLLELGIHGPCDLALVLQGLPNDRNGTLLLLVRVS